MDDIAVFSAEAAGFVGIMSVLIASVVMLARFLSEGRKTTRKRIDELEEAIDEERNKRRALEDKTDDLRIEAHEFIQSIIIEFDYQQEGVRALVQQLREHNIEPIWEPRPLPKFKSFLDGAELPADVE